MKSRKNKLFKALKENQVQTSNMSMVKGGYNSTDPNTDSGVTNPGTWPWTDHEK